MSDTPLAAVMMGGLYSQSPRPAKRWVGGDGGRDAIAGLENRRQGCLLGKQFLAQIVYGSD